VESPLSVDPNWWKSFFGDDYLLITREARPRSESPAGMVDFLVERLELGPDKRVLDLACGHGRHALELARRGVPVVGLDYSEPALALARATVEAEGLEAESVHGDMRELPFADESFDAVANFFTAFGYFAAEPTTNACYAKSRACSSRAESCCSTRSVRLDSFLGIASGRGRSSPTAPSFCRSIDTTPPVAATKRAGR